MPTKWYVNCDDDQAHNKGPDFEVRVAALFSRWWFDCCSSGHSAIGWVATPSVGSNNVAYAEYRSTVQVRFAPRDTVEDIEAPFSRRLALPQVGGDSYTINVYKGAAVAPALTIADLVTWRLYRYSVATASPATEAIYQRIRGDLLDGFADAFIELEEAQASTSNHPGLVTKRSPWLLHARGQKAAAAGVHILFVDFLGGNPEQRVDVFANVGAADAWAFAEERWRWDLQLREREAWHVDADANQAPVVTIDGAPVAAEHFEWAKHGDRDARLTILSPEANAALSQGKPATVTYRFVTKIGGTSFNAQHCVVVTKDMPFPFAANQGYLDRAALIVILHELGHQLGLAVYAEKHRNGQWRAANDLWYTNRHGGSGTHCSHNTQLRANGHADALHYKVYTTHVDGLVYTPSRPSPPLCVMYHSRTEISHQIPGFCPRCIEILKRRDLTPAGNPSFTKDRPVGLFDLE